METKKYIIEIPDNTAWIQWVKVSDKDGHVCFDFKDPEDLIPYTEPDLEQAQKKAYYDGYETAKHDYEGCLKQAHTDAIRMKGYQKGLSDAWDAARKIEFLSAREFDKVFTGYDDCFKVFENYTPQEAIEKIRQYEQEQEEIKVGDEVEMKCGVRPAIYMQGTKGSDEIYLLFSDGSCGVHSKSEIERKTGRHFPEIAEVLRKMQEERE